jgi:hypothetical protein
LGKPVGSYRGSASAGRVAHEPGPFGLAAATFTLSGLQLGWVAPADGKHVAIVLMAFATLAQLVASLAGRLPAGQTMVESDRETRVSADAPGCVGPVVNWQAGGTGQVSPPMSTS